MELESEKFYWVLQGSGQRCRGHLSVACQTSIPVTVWAEGVFQGHIFSSNVTHPSICPGFDLAQQDTRMSHAWATFLQSGQSHVHFKWNLKPSRHAFSGSSHELVRSVLMSLRSERQDGRNAQWTRGVGSVPRLQPRSQWQHPSAGTPRALVSLSVLQDGWLRSTRTRLTLLPRRASRRDSKRCTFHPPL